MILVENSLRVRLNDIEYELIDDNLRTGWTESTKSEDWQEGQPDDILIYKVQMED